MCASGTYRHPEAAFTVPAARFLTFRSGALGRVATAAQQREEVILPEALFFSDDSGVWCFRNRFPGLGWKTRVSSFMVLARGGQELSGSRLGHLTLNFSIQPINSLPPSSQPSENSTLLEAKWTCSSFSHFPGRSPLSAHRWVLCTASSSTPPRGAEHGWGPWYLLPTGLGFVCLFFNSALLCI